MLKRRMRADEKLPEKMASTAAVGSDTNEYYAIDEILNSRRNSHAQLEYLIKWKDQPSSERSWQPVDNLFAKKQSHQSTSSLEDDQQSNHEEASSKTKRIASSGKEPMPTEPAEQPSNEHVSPKQRGQKRRKNFTAINKNVEQINSNEPPNKRPHNERIVDRVLKLRKRSNRHEYLVKWENSADDEWIDRDVMITKYSQSVIAYFESIINFKDRSN